MRASSTLPTLRQLESSCPKPPVDPPEKTPDPIDPDMGNLTSATPPVRSTASWEGRSTSFLSGDTDGMFASNNTPKGAWPLSKGEPGGPRFDLIVPGRTIMGAPGTPTPVTVVPRRTTVGDTERVVVPAAVAEEEGEGSPTVAVEDAEAEDHGGEPSLGGKFPRSGFANGESDNGEAGFGRATQTCCVAPRTRPRSARDERGGECRLSGPGDAERSLEPVGLGPPLEPPVIGRAAAGPGGLVTCCWETTLRGACWAKEERAGAGPVVLLSLSLVVGDESESSLVGEHARNMMILFDSRLNPYRTSGVRTNDNERT